MARTALTVTPITRTGTAATLTAANVDGHSVANNGRSIYIEVNNGGAGAITVTVQTPQQVNGLAVAELAVTLNAGERKKIGPFPKATFDQSGADAGKVFVDFSDVTSVTCGAFQI